MSMTNHIKTATAAIAANTALLGIDDEGDAMGTGLWHLLHSLVEYAAEEGIDFDVCLSASKRDGAGTSSKLYLIKAEDVPGETTVVMPVVEYEFEVRASSVKEACGLVVGGLRKHPDIAVRHARNSYTHEYVAPDWDKYAAGGVMRINHPEDVAKAAERAVASGFVPRVSVPETGYSYDGNFDPVRAARVVLGIDDGERDEAKLTRMLESLAVCAERSAVDFNVMVEDVKAEFKASKMQGEDDRYPRTPAY